MTTSKNTGWTPQSEKDAVSLLRTIERDAKTRQLPSEVFEAFVRTFKKVATELVIFNEKGHIYLTKRLSKEQNPTDPYASEWHIPGAMHSARETSEMVYQRLLKNEIGSAVKLDEPVQVGVYEVDDGRRGMFYGLINVTRVSSGEIPINEYAAFFDPKELPEPIVSFHRDMVIPQACAANCFV